MLVCNSCFTFLLKFILGYLCEMLVVLQKSVEVALRQVLRIQNAIIGTPDCTDQLIQLDLNSCAITILCVLDEKNHQECNDSRASVNYELPRVAKMEDGS